MPRKFKEFGNTQDNFNLEIRVTSKCNYQCYYCTDYNVNTNPVIELDAHEINRLIQSIKRYTDKQIYVYILGGEPTIYKNLLNLIVDISTHLTSDDIIEIQSNMYKTIDWFKQAHDVLKTIPVNVYFSASYHNTQVKDFKSFLSKCVFLKSVNLFGNVLCMYNSLKSVINHYNILKRVLGDSHVDITYLYPPSYNVITLNDGEVSSTDMTFEARKLGEDPDMHEIMNDETSWYFKDELEYVDQNGSSGTTSRYKAWLYMESNFHNYDCHIAKHYIVIDWYGDCYKCHNDLFSPSPALFNINKPGFDYDTYFNNITTCVCPYTFCNPQGLIQYKKVYNAENDTPRVKCDKKYNSYDYKTNNK